ncbi:high-affinity choline transporter 1-like [Mytilus edulis]|uniref:high-affinity choline transporter 1-like n=1 Tax=Mytilus edulis TaxID=6550 RepID=UPI0039EF746F
MILGAIPWQVYFQRVLAAKSAYIAELLSYLGVIGCFIVVIPSLLVGIIATQTDWSMTTYMSGNSSVLADKDIPLVLPLVMEHLCPKTVALFGLGAVAAAVMSSVDSAVLSSSGQFSRNVYKRIIRKTPSEKEQIWVLRASTIVFGVIATSVSIYVRSIYALWVLCSDIIYVIFFPQLTCAIYFSSANTYGSLVAFIVGLLFRVAGGEMTLGLDPIIKYPWHKVCDDRVIVQLFPHKTLSILLSLFSLLFVSWFTNWLFDNGILSPNLISFENIQGLNIRTSMYYPPLMEAMLRRRETTKLMLHLQQTLFKIYVQSGTLNQNSSCQYTYILCRFTICNRNYSAILAMQYNNCIVLHSDSGRVVTIDLSECVR